VLNGGADNDRLYGGNGDDIMNGGDGNDYFNGGAGSDTFVFDDGFGADTISGFAAGVASDDVIDLSAVSSLNSFSEVVSAAYQSGYDTVIDIDVDSSITLSNIALSQLHEDDFRFA